MGHIKKIKQIIENDKSIFFPAALKKLKTSIKWLKYSRDSWAFVKTTQLNTAEQEWLTGYLTLLVWWPFNMVVYA